MLRGNLRFHNPDLLFRQPLQFVHQPVDLPVRGLDLTLDGSLLVAGSSGCQLLVQLQYLIDEGDHAIVAGDTSWIGCVDGTDG